MLAECEVQNDFTVIYTKMELMIIRSQVLPVSVLFTEAFIFKLSDPSFLYLLHTVSLTVLQDSVLQKSYMSLLILAV